ncbi:TPA: hypothetical protein ACT2FU_000521 [Streptococcus suis]
MGYELAKELSKGEIIDKYVIDFLSKTDYRVTIEGLEFSNSLIKEVEDILFELDLENREPVDLLSALHRYLDKFVYDNRLRDYQIKEGFNNRVKLIKALSLLVSDEKQWVMHNLDSKKQTSNIRRCILKVLNAITDFQNNQIVGMDNLIEILQREFPMREEMKRDQVFLSHAYLDRVLTLGLFLYFYDKGIYLYIDWMHQGKGLSTKNIKGNLIPTINNSSQILFLRTLNSELGLQGGNRQIREWCAWEIGSFDNKSNGSTSERFYIDRFRQNKKVRSRSPLIQDYQPLRAIINGRLS